MHQNHTKAWAKFADLSRYNDNIMCSLKKRYYLVERVRHAYQALQLNLLGNWDIRIS